MKQYEGYRILGLTTHYPSCHLPMPEPEYRAFKASLLPLLSSKGTQASFKKHLAAVLYAMTSNPAIKNQFVMMAMRVTGQSGGKRHIENPDYGHELIENFRRGRGHFGVAIAIYYLLHRLPDTSHYHYASMARSIDSDLFGEGVNVHQALGWFPQIPLPTHQLDPAFYDTEANRLDRHAPLPDRDRTGVALAISYHDPTHTFTLRHSSTNAETRFLTIQDRRNESHLDNVATLLSWQYQLTEKVIGRDHEMRGLMQWAVSPDIRSVKLLYGEGGVGKTRLAFRLAKQLRERGWQAGECEGSFVGNWYMGSEGMLLIIDYPEENQEWVAQFLKTTAKATLPPPKLRILLLCRDREFLSAITRFAQNIVDRQPLALEPIASADLQWQLFSSAWAKLEKMRQTMQRSPHTYSLDPAIPVTQRAFTQWLTLNAEQATPLIVIALAVYLFDLDDDEPKILDLRAPDIVRYLSIREENRIREEVIAFSRHRKIEPILDYQGIVLLKAIAAIRMGLNGSVLAEMIEALQQRQVDYPPPAVRLLEQMSFAYQGELSALQPDILAADFLAYAMEQYAKRDRHHWLEIGTGLFQITDGQQPYQAIQRNFARLGRLSYDIGVKLRLPWLLVSFGQDIKERPEQALWVSNYLVGYRFIDPHLQQVLEAATVEAATLLPDDVSTARHLTEVARLAYERGLCSEEAITSAQKAIRLYDTLAVPTENYNAIIARNCYVFLVCMQQGTTLTDTEYQELDIMMQWADTKAKQLIEQRRTPRHIMVVADTLFTQSYLQFCDVIPDAGEQTGQGDENNQEEIREAQEKTRYEAALTLRIESVRLYEEIAQENMSQYGGHYGSALAQLAVAYQLNDWIDEGIEAGQTACEVLAPFAAKDPGHWEFNYANLLYFQALRLAHQDRIEESLPIHQQAITHYSHLYNLNPGQFCYHLLEAMVRFMGLHGGSRQLLLNATRVYIEGVRLSALETDYPFPIFLERFRDSNLEKFNDTTLEFLGFLIQWTQNPADPDYDTVFASADAVFKEDHIFAEHV